jgi:peptidylprolyl isomerase
MISRRRALAAAALLPVTLKEAAAVTTTDPENTLLMELKSGTVTIALLPDVAPAHVERIKTLTREGQYDNVAFHRVIAGFMAQTGDVEHGDMEDGFNPGRAGTGGSSYPDLPAEFSNVPFERGTLGMARSSSPNSANSQFFICFEDAPHLNGQYTVFGQVTDGMTHVDNIKLGTGGNGSVVGEPDRIVSMRVAAD